MQWQPKTKIMNRMFVLLIMIFFLSSCKETYQPRLDIELSIQEFKIDSTSIRAIVAVDENTMYFTGANAKFGFTTDAGKSWNIQDVVYQDSIKPEYRSIAKNGENLFILNVANPALIYKISDSKTKVVYTENHPKVFYDSMAFFDEQNGIGMGDPTDDCLSIIITTDGGNTWSKIDCSILPKLVEGEAAFAASNTNIAIVNSTVWIVTGGTNARVFKSSDKGETWQVFDTPIIQGNGPQGIYSVDFYDEHNGIVIGGDYSNPDGNNQNKAITKDGGETWTSVSDGQDPNYRSCVQYVPNTNGQEIFAVGKMGISFSNDAGVTWGKVSSDDYYTIQFVDENTAWLGGHEKVGLMKF